MNERSLFVSSLTVVLLLVLNQSDCSCIHGDVRLTGGLGDYEGNVQVCIDAEWRYVCDYEWGSNEAKVVCKQLGFSTTSIEPTTGSYYGYGNGTLWKKYVICFASNMKLMDCPTRPYKPESCQYQNIAGVVCPSGGSGCINGSIRLVSSSTYYGRSEGRVEVCSNNEWGTVCGNGWDSNDATVACKQLGYTGYIDYNSDYSSVSGSIWLTNLACNSSHTSLFDCPHSTDITGCTHSNDVLVKCYSIDTSSCTHGDVKLWSAYESTPDNEGIPLVCMNGNWYPMYDSSSCYSLELTCKTAGYSELEYNRNNAGLKYGYYYKNYFKFSCSSTSTYNTLWDCLHESYEYSTESEFDNLAGVRCYKNMVIATSSCSVEGSVRLADGETANEGRIEYCYNNEWAPMCDIKSVYTADLICIELGYNLTGSQVIADNRFGRSSARSLFNYLSCDSSFTSLSQCGIHRIMKPQYCGQLKQCYVHYGLRCYNLLSDPECTDGDVHLVDGIIEQEGRPEVCVNGLWSQICGKGWGNQETGVMCLSLGYSRDGTTNYATEFGSGYGPIIWSDVKCSYRNKDIFDCSKSYSYCNNLYIAGVRCTEGCSDGDVRLVGGASVNEGTVEVCYDELWGLISDDGWSDNEAIVVCRQLGYNGENTADHKSFIGSYYGKPNKTIHLNNVNCLSLETNISSCKAHQLSLLDGKALLLNTDVAGVNCTGQLITPAPTTADVTDSNDFFNFTISSRTWTIIGVSFGSVIGAIVIFVVLFALIGLFMLWLQEKRDEWKKRHKKRNTNLQARAEPVDEPIPLEQAQSTHM